MRSSLRSTTLTLTAGWTIIMVGLHFWALENETAQSTELLKYQARSFFQEIITTRHWNATHGGVYVPVTDDTPPNPYLEDPLRDVETLGGLKLTKINPAYMTRQIGEIATRRNAVWFHITSLMPIRPENAPDRWETRALESFAEGTPEIWEMTEKDAVFRYMAPLKTERPCLKCHEWQGYEEGDIRGGISVSLRADPILNLKRSQIIRLSAVHAVLWIFGLVAIGIFYVRLHQEERVRQQTIAKLNEALAQVKTLSGLLPICANCHKIRDDKGYWNRIESYLEARSDACFTHSICPDCVQKLYPNFHPAKKEDT